MLMTSELKVGTAFYYENEKKVKEPLIVQKFLRQVSGRQGMTTFLRVQNLVTKSTMEVGLDAGVKFDEVELDKRTTVLSYIEGEGDGANYVFMDQDTYDQVALTAELVAEAVKYIRENDMATVKFYKEGAFDVEEPNFVDLEVVETEPGVKGNNATNVTKAATVETGAVIQVPIFINEGERIQIDTRTGEYLGRSK